jgi:hypothetical protein
VFGSKILYPPPDLLSRLAELSKCAVIGSSTIGTPTAGYVILSLNNKRKENNN